MKSNRDSFLNTYCDTHSINIHELIERYPKFLKVFAYTLCSTLDLAIITGCDFMPIRFKKQIRKSTQDSNSAEWIAENLQFKFIFLFRS